MTTLSAALALMKKNGGGGGATKSVTVAQSLVANMPGGALANGTIVEAVGIPTYVDDVAEYSAYSLTNTGWYVFSTIPTPDGVTVTAGTTVTGAAGYIATVGEDHVDVAVYFGTTAETQIISIDWGE